MKEVLCSFKIGGFVHEFCLVDYEYLKKLKKHKKNRPSGDIDDDIAPYLPEEVSAAKKVTNKLYERFKSVGFDPNVKTIVVGNINGIEFKLDAQHTIAAIRIINEEAIKKSGKPEYDLFKCEIIYFEDNENAFLKMLEKYNNLVTKYKPQDYANTSIDEIVAEEMRKICIGLSISPKLALTMMYGNLSSDLYENLTINRAKKNYNIAYEEMRRLFDDLDKNGGKEIANIFRKGDAFIVLNELLSNISHKTFLSDKVNGISEKDAICHVKELSSLLIDHMLKIDQIAFNAFSKSKSREVTRKKYYKATLKQLLLNRSNSISPEYRKSVQFLNGTELKKIIETWAEEGKNGNNGANKS